MAKKRVGKFPKAFRQYAVERLKQLRQHCGAVEGIGCASAPVVSWRDQLEPAESADGPPPVNSRETTLRKVVSRLKRALAEKTLEVDFFKGALREVKARRQRSGNSGGTASTPISGT